MCVCTFVFFAHFYFLHSLFQGHGQSVKKKILYFSHFFQFNLVVISFQQNVSNITVFFCILIYLTKKNKLESCIQRVNKKNIHITFIDIIVNQIKSNDWYIRKNKLLKEKRKIEREREIHFRFSIQKKIEIKIKLNTHTHTHTHALEDKVIN